MKSRTKDHRIRIAILVLLHNWSKQQENLINYLAGYFDVYIHVDKKTSINTGKIRRASVFVSKKYSVYWGSYNQIRATLHLFQEAHMNRYDRYILISGEDIPLKSGDGIRKFFHENSKEYFQYYAMPADFWHGNGGFDRVDFFYPNSLSRVGVSYIRRKLNTFLENSNEKILIPLMKRYGRRPRLEMPYYGGANWMNITDTCVSIMLKWISENPWYLRKFRWTRRADEIFFQTCIINCAPNVEIENDALRYIDWNSGPEAPRILRINDLDNLRRSKSLFARKVNYQIDESIITELYSLLV
jgi:hypothetical protein